MRASPTEDIGSEMAEILTFENQPALPTDAPPSDDVSAARIIASNITQATHSTDPQD
jgi:hypothetical protein